MSTTVTTNLALTSTVTTTVTPFITTTNAPAFLVTNGQGRPMYDWTSEDGELLEGDLWDIAARLKEDQREGTPSVTNPRVLANDGTLLPVQIVNRRAKHLTVIRTYLEGCEIEEYVGDPDVDPFAK